MEVEVAMMLLQHVVKKQVQWPCREIERAGRGLRIAIQAVQHILRLEILLGTSSLQCVTAMAAIVYAGCSKTSALLKSSATIEPTVMSFVNVFAISDIRLFYFTLQNYEAFSDHQTKM